jgi:NAD(P)-dependent dehydrogenase (short-subunit alcohol dehydrogenase family)
MQEGNHAMAKVLVTGCNRGIGLQLCMQFQDRGDEVTGVCRSASLKVSTLGIRVIHGIDVTVADNVAALAKTLEGESIDILVNNAGILQSDRLGNIDYDSMLEQYRVNTLGPLRVTEALLPNLHDGSKVAIVSSRVGSIEDNSSGNNYGYRASKVAVNMVGANLRHDLEPRGIAVVLLHPGLVATDMTNGTGVSPAESARGLIERIDDLGLANTGSFWHAEGYRLPW